MSYWKFDDTFVESFGEVTPLYYDSNNTKVVGVEISKALYEYEVEKQKLVLSDRIAVNTEKMKEDRLISDKRKQAVLLALGVSLKDLELFL